MIDIMLRGIVGNASNIKNVANHLNKVETNLSISMLLIMACVYVTGRTVIKQEERIQALEEVVNDIKSKGE